MAAAALKPEVQKFIKNEDDNSASMELKGVDGNNVKLSIAGVMDFTVIVGENGTFTVTTKDETLQDEWLSEMKEYLKQGKKSIKDVLIKATDVFVSLPGGEEEQHEEEEDDEDLIEGLEGGTESWMEPITTVKEASSSYDPELEKAKEKFNLSGANQAAVSRLMKDYMTICKSDTHQFGYSAQPAGDNLFVWHIKIFGFNKKDKDERPIAEGLEKFKQKTGQDHVLFEMSFPPTYPFAPPFIRVLTPRFEFHTGHITIGGSICMELLTSSGWSPGNSIESILVQIRSNLIEGGAKVDMSRTDAYTEAEAKEAFFRVSRRYGWEK